MLTEFQFWHAQGNLDIDADTEQAVVTLMRDLMDWIYERLEAAYEYTMSNEHVDECIRINEYEFTESGSRCVCI